MYHELYPGPDRGQLNRGYAGALSQASEALSKAPGAPPPRDVTFTHAIERDQSVSARIVVRWFSGERRLCLEFDADGIVDYWSEPDFGSLTADDEAGVFAALMQWLDGRHNVVS